MVDSIYLDHAESLHKAGLENSIYPTIRYVWIDLEMKHMVIETENDLNSYKNKNRNVYFCISNIYPDRKFFKFGRTLLYSDGT